MTDRSVEHAARRARSEIADVVAERARPDVDSFRRRHVRRRTGLAATAAGVLALAGIGALAVLGGSPTSVFINTSVEPRVAQTDEDRTVPLDEADVALQLLAVRSWQHANLALIDLDRGEVTLFSQASFGMSRNPIDGGFLMRDGTGVAWSDGVVTVFRGDSDEPLLVHRPDELIMPPAIAVVPTVEEDRLWIVQYTPGIGEDGFDEGARGIVELVDLDTGKVVTSAGLPPNTYAVAATTDGLILNTSVLTETADGWTDQIGSHAVLELTGGGELTELARGHAVATSSSWVATLTDELLLLNSQTGERRTISPPVEGAWAMATEPIRATADDGRILMLLTIDNDIYLTAVDPDLAEAVEILYRYDEPPRRAMWDRTGNQIVLVPAFDGPITVLDLRDGSAFMVADAIPPEHHVLPHP
jgi:hypothetical protein